MQNNKHELQMPRALPIVEYDGKLWFFDERLKQIRNIKKPHEYHDLNKEEMFFFKYQDLLKEICECTDSSVAGLNLELPPRKINGEKKNETQ